MFIKSLWTAAAVAFAATAALAQTAAGDPVSDKYADRTIHWREGVVGEVDGASMDIKVYGDRLRHTRGLTRVGDALSMSYTAMSRRDIERMHKHKFKASR